MSVRNLLQASQTASSSLRAENASALARAYLQGACVGDERDEVEGFLFALLDDPSAVVRRALAESLASAEGAPPNWCSASPATSRTSPPSCCRARPCSATSN